MGPSLLSARPGLLYFPTVASAAILKLMSRDPAQAICTKHGSEQGVPRRGYNNPGRSRRE